MQWDTDFVYLQYKMHNLRYLITYINTYTNNIMGNSTHTCGPVVLAQHELVLGFLSKEEEEIVFSECCTLLPVPQVDSQRVSLLGRQPMDLLVPQPVLTDDVSEAHLVLRPRAVEVDQAVFSSLEDLHVTQHRRHDNCKGRRKIYLRYTRRD